MTVVLRRCVDSLSVTTMQANKTQSWPNSADSRSPSSAVTRRTRNRSEHWNRNRQSQLSFSVLMTVCISFVVFGRHGCRWRGDTCIKWKKKVCTKMVMKTTFAQCFLAMGQSPQPSLQWDSDSTSVFSAKLNLWRHHSFLSLRSLINVNQSKLCSNRKSK